MKIQEIGAFEAKTKLSELLDKVERGQSFRITRRGKCVARLVGEETVAHRERGQKLTAWELFQRIQKGGLKLSSKELEKSVRESRRQLLNRTEKLLH
ncbi:MAG: type II toxin-antitoxin system prevent-host-death family antitoxin [Verrucomicrobiota bacterium]